MHERTRTDLVSAAGHFLRDDARGLVGSIDHDDDVRAVCELVAPGDERGREEVHDLAVGGDVHLVLHDLPHEVDLRLSELWQIAERFQLRLPRGRDPPVLLVPEYPALVVPPHPTSVLRSGTRTILFDSTGQRTWYCTQPHATSGMRSAY
eukprot:3268264-Rhodomonas_salina.3